MADVLDAWANTVRSEIERLKALYPELAEDEQLLSDMVEGSTHFDDVLDRISMAFLSKVSLKEANANLQRSIAERGARFDRSAEALKALAMSLMQAAGKRNVVLPSATLFIANGRARLVIDNEAELPQGFVKIERTPIKADIHAALSSGDQIPGAHLEQAAEHLTVRTR